MEPNFSKRQSKANEDVISGWEAEEQNRALPSLGDGKGRPTATR